MDGTVGLISLKKNFEGNKTVLGGVNELMRPYRQFSGIIRKNSKRNLVVRVNDNE